MLYPTELRTELGDDINRIMQTKKGQKLISLLTLDVFWSEYKDSNLGPPGPKPGALPDCATLRRPYYTSRDEWRQLCAVFGSASSAPQ